MDNLQKSELVIAKILEFLMDLGIQRELVSFTEVIGDPDLEPYIATCFYWLEAEGLIRARNYAETDNDFSVISPALTSYGFKLLGQPISLDGDPIKLSEAVRTVTNNEKSYSQIGDFVGGLLGGFTKSIGS